MKIELKEQTKENIKAYTISGIFIVITYLFLKTVQLYLSFWALFLRH